jgi:hypothetical protein
MSDERRLSDHLTDRLIRELILTGRKAGRGEIARILDRMATAPFNSRAVLASPDEQGLHYRGRTVLERDESLFIHLVRRVILDEQWAYGVTEAEYLDDLRRAIRDPSARLAIYQRRGGFISATLTPTDQAVPALRRGPDSLSQVWVVYSADHGIIVSGYQVSSRGELSIPKDTRWLL